MSLQMIEEVPVMAGKVTLGGRLHVGSGAAAPQALARAARRLPGEPVRLRPFGHR
jgi:hypothetical protein